ncbi:unnamed protein product, partial [Rotaria socialis]
MQQLPINQIRFSKNRTGKKLIFGTEELCVDQLQVLQEDIINENQSSEKQHDSNPIETSKNYNRANALSPMNINTASTIIILPTRKEKSVCEVQRKLFGDDTNMNSKHCYSFE